MKIRNLPILLALTMELVSVVIGQAETPAKCPSISITGPAGLTQPGETMVFSANLPSGSDKLSLNWTVSSGTIVSGQGTPVITVQTAREMSGTNTTVTVDVKGLPEGCPMTASETAAVDYTCRLPITVDEWGTIPRRDELTRLDAAGADLQKRPEDMVLVLVIYSARSEHRNATKLRADRIRNHLVQKLKIEEKRLLFVYSKGNERHTRIYVVPKDSTQPLVDGMGLTTNLEN